MLRFLCFILLFLLPFTSLLSQTAVCDTIYWKPEIRLSWVDFRAAPDTNSKFSAISRTSIGYRFRQVEDTIEIRTYCRFLPCKSWTKYQQPNLLLHEQTHFDISELCRRTFVSRLQKMPIKSGVIDVSVKALYDEIQKLWMELDKKYDEETDFSRNKAQQEKWTKEIQARLEEMSRYSVQKVQLALN